MVTDEIVVRALALVAEGGGNYEYFFSQLKSPDWIAPLLRKERFSHPPDAESDGSYIRFPAWPEGEYLLRMAPLEPEAVFAAIDAKCYCSNNQTVHQLLLQIAARLPASLAAQIVRAETTWASMQPSLYPLYSERSVPAIVSLAAGGRSDVALELADSILEVRAPDQRKDQSDPLATEIPFRFSVDPIARIDPWRIQRFLFDISNQLTESAPLETLTLISRILDEAILIHDNGRGNDDDFSTTWRPYIASGRFENLLDVLVTAVRDMALLVSRGNPRGFGSVQSVFARHRWPIFRRLEFYVLSETEALPLNLVNDLLVSARYYENARSNPEFNTFLAKWVPQVSPEVRATIFAIVDAGPDLSRYSRYLAEQSDEGEREKARNWLRDEWRLGWLTALKNALDEPRLNDVEALTERYGPPLPEFAEGGFRAFGHASAMTIGDMKKLSTHELIEYLRAWTPPPLEHPAAPSRSGIGQTLKAWAEEDPLFFSKNLLSFLDIDLHPTYLRSLLDAFTVALRGDRPFDAYAVAKAIEWLLRNTTVSASEHYDLSEDPGWSWAHMSAARFLSELFLHRERLDTSRHQELWPALELIAGDPTPSEADEKKYRRKPERFASLALNSTRPVGLEAVMRYARWLKLSLGKSVGAASLPEAFQVLERHLDPQVDTSVAVREMYGMQFSLLAWLDRKWLEDQLPALFPGKPQRLLDRFAWSSFLRFSNPNVEILPAMRFRYESAIRALQSNDAEVRDTDRTLGGHLMQYYAVGAIELDDPLLTDFFSKASAAVKTQTLSEVGWKIGKENGGSLSPRVQQRLMAFWEARLTVGKQRMEISKEELAAFGWWFASKQFPDDWAVEQAVSVLDTFRHLKPDFAVVQRLVELAPAFPFESVHCLGILFEEDRDGWAIHGWGDNPRIILQQGLNSDERSRHEANRVINILASHGHREFRTLVSES